MNALWNVSARQAGIAAGMAYHNRVVLREFERAEVWSERYRFYRSIADVATGRSRPLLPAPCGEHPKGENSRSEVEGRSPADAVPREDEAGAQPLPTPVVTTGEHR